MKTHTMQKPAHEWRDLLAYCRRTGQRGIRDLIAPHLEGKDDHDPVRIPAPLPMVMLVAMTVSDMRQEWR